MLLREEASTVFASAAILVSSASFFWPKSITRPVNIQGTGRQIPWLSGKISKVTFPGGTIHRWCQYLLLIISHIRVWNLESTLFCSRMSVGQGCRFQVTGPGLPLDVWIWERSFNSLDLIFLFFKYILLIMLLELSQLFFYPLSPSSLHVPSSTSIPLPP